jgi:hypothetical protein
MLTANLKISKLLSLKRKSILFNSVVKIQQKIVAKTIDKEVKPCYN